MQTLLKVRTLTDLEQVKFVLKDTQAINTASYKRDNFLATNKQICDENTALL